jgi:hypothetical protein
VALLRAASERARRSLTDLRPLVDAEERRWRAGFRSHLGEALARIVPRAQAMLAQRLAEVGPSSPSRTLRLEAGSLVAQEVARAAIDGWRGEETAEARRL